MTSLPFAFKYAIVSEIIFKLLSNVVFKISDTCKSHALPNTLTAGVPAHSSDCTPASSSGRFPTRQVEPKAHSFACSSFNSFACVKNSISFGLEPGLPASIYETPSASSVFTILILSETKKISPPPARRRAAWNLR